MASADGQGHLLSLKVMRVSRPGLAAAWEPFYSSSSSFSAHSTASILSLQGTTPLPGHPKTLRDLTHVSEFLTLPSAFGAIQLGETFSCCFSANNETHAAVQGVHVRVEMQTANSKSLLCELGGEERTLAAGDSLENIVDHEVKELGQHVLGCTVTYRLPPGYPYAPGPVEGSDDPSLQSFRKFYKFSVTNPLSVKTKVHAPKSPSALLDPVEREKVFLEVHVQNTTQETMWFDRMDFECAEGWHALDANRLSVPDPSTGEHAVQQLFSGSMALMQPQAIRQYIYILSPSSLQTFPITHPPGAVIPLGRLDISWRSKFGEPGRLLTSMLSRRIPGPPQPPLPIPSQPPSAIPPYLQRAPQGTPSSPSRPRSPQLPLSRPSSPPPGSIRSSSPFRPRAQPGTPTSIPRPLSPATSVSALGSAIQPHPLIIPEPVPDLDVDLVVMRRAGDVVRVGIPFTLALRLSIAATIPHGRRRRVRFVVQHLMPRRVSVQNTSTSEPPAGGLTPSRDSSSASTLATSTQAPANVVNEPPVSSPDKLVATGGDPLLSLPPPYFDTHDESRNTRLRWCSFLGPSAIPLDPVDLTQSDASIAMGDLPRLEASQTFELTFLPHRTGFVCVGGLRLILVGDHLSDAEIDPGTYATAKEPRTLRELDVIAEVWIQP